MQSLKMRGYNQYRDTRKPSKVYLIRCKVTGLTKIGISVDAWVRLHEIQLVCPTELEMLAARPGGRKEEKRLHLEYADQRRHGEWFSLTEEQLSEAIESLPAIPSPEPEPEEREEDKWTPPEDDDVAHLRRAAEALNFLDKDRIGPYRPPEYV